MDEHSLLKCICIYFDRHTSFVDFNNTVIADLFQQAEEGDLMGAEARGDVIRADVVN